MKESDGERKAETDPLKKTRHGLPLIEFREIEMELPGFKYMDKIPVLELEFPDVGEVVLHHFNTAIVLYESSNSEFGHMDHVTVNDPGQLEHPLFIFPDPESEDTRIPGISRLTRTSSDGEWFNQLVSALKEKDFTVMYPPRHPFPSVIEEYYDKLRGSTSIEKVLGRIIKEAGK